MEGDLQAMLTHIYTLRLVAQTSLPLLTRWLKTGALRKHVTIHLHMHLNHKVSPTLVGEHGPLRRITERVRNQILHVFIPPVVEEMVDVARQISQERIKQHTVEEVPG